MTGPTYVNVPVFRLTVPVFRLAHIHKNMSKFKIKPSRGKMGLSPCGVEKSVLLCKKRMFQSVWKSRHDNIAVPESVPATHPSPFSTQSTGINSNAEKIVVKISLRDQTDRRVYNRELSEDKLRSQDLRRYTYRSRVEMSIMRWMQHPWVIRSMFNCPPLDTRADACNWSLQ